MNSTSRHLTICVVVFLAQMLCNSLLLQSFAEAQSVQLSEASGSHPWILYMAGNVEAARSGYQKIVKSSEASAKPDAMWNSYMEYGWFLHQVGEDQESIKVINKAWAVGKKEKNPFFIGRSISWLAWAYADLGLYELALQLYKRAIEMGAPNGKIEHVHVWGMSTQEMGYVFMRMGDLKKARELITETTNYARQHGIDVGVSEGGAHLAELNLMEGKFREAAAIAEEAVAASRACECSPLNMARALMALAKAKFEEAKADPTLLPEVEKKIHAAIEYSEKTKIRRFMAEGNILLSKTLPSQEFEKRYVLVGAALDILSKVDNEHRGVAEMELGRVYLDNSRAELAEKYLKQGLSVNEAMFRKVDSAQIKAELAKIDGLNGDMKARLKKFEDAANSAQTSGAIIIALENQEILSKELFEQGYYTLAKSWNEAALLSLNKVLSEKNDKAVKEKLFERKLILTERLVNTVLKLAEFIGKERPAPNA